MITVDAVYKSLEKMRGIYPFKDEDTVFRMDRDLSRGEKSVICIATLDEETGIKVRLEKDAGEAELYRAKSIDGEYQEYNGDWN